MMRCAMESKTTIDSTKESLFDLLQSINRRKPSFRTSNVVGSETWTFREFLHLSL
jgi:hypothetical protein